MTQLALISGMALMIGWTLLSGAVLAIDRLGPQTSASAPAGLYEQRLAALASERDSRAAEAREAQLRFAVALEQLSKYQSELLQQQQRTAELEAGIDTIRGKLGTALAAAPAPQSGSGQMDLALDALSQKLRDTAQARDEAAAKAQQAIAEAAAAKANEAQLLARNEEIFGQIEDAVTASIVPFEDMFDKLGLDTDKLLAEIDEGYSGLGGPLTAASVSTKGNAAINHTEARASEIVVSLDQVNRYRIATAKLPLDMPVKSAFRFSSPFGKRWGRMHNGVDMAAPVGTPILTTGDGVVTFAGWQRGYGNIIKIEHALGTETRYGHLSKIRVKVGQKVSHGMQIGDMGNTGRSTGSHLHYEVRVNGKAVNPMSFIKAAQNVF